jgi:hypothetical protein
LFYVEHESEPSSSEEDRQEQLEFEVYRDSLAFDDEKKTVATSTSDKSQPKTDKSHIEAIWKEMKCISHVGPSTTSFAKPMPSSSELSRGNGKGPHSTSGKANVMISGRSDDKPVTTIPKGSHSTRLGTLMSSLGKKPKMSTLEESRLDWHSYVQNTEMVDELRKNRQDGYLERMAFLQRTEEREFLREQQLKKRHKPS